MAILLTVLKIIGIVLLGILGLLVLLLLMVLFVPVRYRVKAEYKDEVLAYIKVSYLLHIISFLYRYDGTSIFRLKILGIPINLKKSSKKKKTDDSKADSVNDKETEDDKDKTSEENGNNKKKTVKNIIAILSDDETKKAFDVCKKRLGKMLKCLIPKKMDITVRYGLSNPYYTSVIMAIYDIFYVYLGKVITLYPIYYEEEIDAKANIKGKLTAGPIIWHLVLVVLDKNCRSFYKKIRQKA